MTTRDYTIEQKWTWMRNAALTLYGARLAAQPMSYITKGSVEFMPGAIQTYKGEEPPMVIWYTPQAAVNDALQLWKAVEEARDNE